MKYENIRWGILGLLVGDALGVPYEFTLPHNIPAKNILEYEPPPGFRKAYNVPPGTWSDDGAQALCILDVVLSKPPNLVEGVAKNLLAWRDEGFMAVDGKVFDIGSTTNEALNRYSSGISALESGMVGERYKANGSLMRTLPIAFLDLEDEALVRCAMGQSKVTHGEPLVMIICALYVLWAKYIIVGHYEPWEKAFKVLHETVPHGVLTPFIEAVQSWTGPIAGTGFVLDSLYSAKYAFETGDSYESVVKIAIQFGNDTDTTAAIAGGLAGLKYKSIPKRWLDDLRGKEILTPILARMEQAYK